MNATHIIPKPITRRNAAIFAKRHYEQLAAAIRSDARLDDSRGNVARVLGELFETDNPRFDWKKWLKAALCAEDLLHAQGNHAVALWDQRS